MKYLVFILVIVGLGCASTVPPVCVPEVITREVLVPITVWNTAEILPELHLPTYPLHPSSTATNEEKKDWAIAVADVTLKREVLLKARVEALTIQLEATRSPH